MKELFFKLGVLYIFLLSFIMVQAQTCFIEGTEWKMQMSGSPTPYYPTWLETVTLERCDDDGTEALGLYLCRDEDISTRKFVSYVRTEGEKVFFKIEPGADAEWYLLYDFGLKPGEGCYVYSPAFLPFDPDSNDRRYVRCTEIVETYPSGINYMSLEVGFHETDDYFDDGVWIKGIASLTGVLHNNTFGLSGMGAVLLEVSCNGEKIYQRGEAGVAATEVPEDIFIRTDGRDVYISTAGEACRGAVFTVSGMKVADVQVGPSTVGVTLPSSGVYIMDIPGVLAKKLVVK